MSSALLPKNMVGIDAALAPRGPDAALLTLRPRWLAGRAAYHAALETHEAIDIRAMARDPALDALDGASRASVRRVCVGVDEAARDLEPRLVLCAERLKRETEDADAAMVDHIAATPARTQAGILFKVEVSKTWGHDHPDLVQSIMDDIEALGSVAARLLRDGAG